MRTVVFVLMLLALPLGSFGAAIPGTVVTSKITRGNDLLTGSIGDTVEMKGTPKHVADITERDAIPGPRREVGMDCWVISENNMYRLVGGTNNSNWVIASGSISVQSSGASVASAITNVNYIPEGGLVFHFTNNNGSLSLGILQPSSVRAIFDGDSRSTPVGHPPENLPNWTDILRSNYVTWQRLHSYTNVARGSQTAAGMDNTYQTNVHPWMSNGSNGVSATVAFTWQGDNNWFAGGTDGHTAYLQIRNVWRKYRRDGALVVAFKEPRTLHDAQNPTYEQYRLDYNADIDANPDEYHIVIDLPALLGTNYGATTVDGTHQTPAAHALIASNINYCLSAFGLLNVGDQGRRILTAAWTTYNDGFGSVGGPWFQKWTVDTSTQYVRMSHYTHRDSPLAGGVLMGPNGDVGINVSAGQAVSFQINGTTYGAVNVDGRFISPGGGYDTAGSVRVGDGLFTNTFQLQAGAGTGKVLTSDANGFGTWQTSSGGGGSPIAPTNYVLLNGKYVDPTKLYIAVLGDSYTAQGVGPTQLRQWADMSFHPLGGGGYTNWFYYTNIALGGHYWLLQTNLFFDNVWGSLPVSATNGTNVVIVDQVSGNDISNPLFTGYDIINLHSNFYKLMHSRGYQVVRPTLQARTTGWAAVDETKVWQFNKWVAGSSNLIDIAVDFEGICPNLGQDMFYGTGDGVHPNQICHEEMAHEMVLSIKYGSRVSQRSFARFGTSFQWRNSTNLALLAKLNDSGSWDQLIAGSVPYHVGAPVSANTPIAARAQGDGSAPTLLLRTVAGATAPVVNVQDTNENTKFLVYPDGRFDIPSASTPSRIANGGLMLQTADGLSDNQLQFLNVSVGGTNWGMGSSQTDGRWGIFTGAPGGVRRLSIDNQGTVLVEKNLNVQSYLFGLTTNSPMPTTGIGYVLYYDGLYAHFNAFDFGTAAFIGQKIDADPLLLNPTSGGNVGINTNGLLTGLGVFNVRGRSTNHIADFYSPSGVRGGFISSNGVFCDINGNPLVTNAVAGAGDVTTAQLNNASNVLAAPMYLMVGTSTDLADDYALSLDSGQFANAIIGSTLKVTGISGSKWTNLIARGLALTNLTPSRPLYIDAFGNATNATGTPDGTKVMNDAGVLVANGSGGAQTPWASDIAGADYGLDGIDRLTISNSASPMKLTVTNGLVILASTNQPGYSNFFTSGLVFSNAFKAPTNTAQEVGIDFVGNAFMTGTGGTNVFPRMQMVWKPTIQAGSSGAAGTMVWQSRTNETGAPTTNMTLNSAGNAVVTGSVVAQGGTGATLANNVTAPSFAGFLISSMFAMNSPFNGGLTMTAQSGTPDFKSLFLGGTNTTNGQIRFISSTTANPLFTLRDGTTNAWADLAVGNLYAATNIVVTNGTITAPSVTVSNNSALAGNVTISDTNGAHFSQLSGPNVIQTNNVTLLYSNATAGVDVGQPAGTGTNQAHRVALTPGQVVTYNGTAYVASNLPAPTSFSPTTIAGAGNGNTNYTLLSSTPEMFLGSSNVNIVAVMGTAAGRIDYFSTTITNLSGINWGISFSSITNRYRFSGSNGTNAPNVLTNGTLLLLSAKNLDTTNILIGYTYFTPGL